MEGRCASPARGLRWQRADGTLEPVRCGASNRCDYCAMFAALEAALVLKLDAQLCCPTVGLTTTTRDPAFTFEQLRKAEHNLWRSLRRLFDPLEYVGFLEWTTGGGTRAGGHRRPHLHHLVKGIPVDDPRLAEQVDDEGKVTTELEQLVSERWHRYTGDAFVVECRPLRTPAGAIAYLSLHHHKKTQAPPPGFTGRRLRPSKGYYEQPVAELRALAQELAAHERVVIATKRALAVELYGEETPAEWEADRELTSAIAGALRSMAADPLEVQLSIDGGGEYELEKRELVARAARELERIRAAQPPELVRVLERDEVDPETGTFARRAVAVLGPARRAA